MAVDLERAERFCTFHLEISGTRGEGRLLLEAPGRGLTYEDQKDLAELRFAFPKVLRELEAARAVCEAGELLPFLLTTPEHKLTGRELLFAEALAAYARAKGKGEGGGNDAK